MKCRRKCEGKKSFMEGKKRTWKRKGLTAREIRRIKIRLLVKIKGERDREGEREKEQRERSEREEDDTAEVN